RSRFSNVARRADKHIRAPDPHLSERSPLAGLGARRRRCLLLSALIEIDRGTNEIFQRPLVDLIALEEIDRAALIAFETGVEQLFGIGKTRRSRRSASPCPCERWQPR